MPRAGAGEGSQARLAPTPVGVWKGGRGAPGKEHAPGKRASYKRLVLNFSATGAGDWPSLQSTGQKDTPPGRRFCSGWRRAPCWDLALLWWEPGLPSWWQWPQWTEPGQGLF